MPSKNAIFAYMITVLFLTILVTVSTTFAHLVIESFLNRKYQK